MIPSGDSTFHSKSGISIRNNAWSYTVWHASYRYLLYCDCYSSELTKQLTRVCSQICRQSVLNSLPCCQKEQSGNCWWGWTRLFLLCIRLWVCFLISVVLTRNVYIYRSYCHLNCCFCMFLCCMFAISMPVHSPNLARIFMEKLLNFCVYKTQRHNTIQNDLQLKSSQNLWQQTI